LLLNVHLEKKHRVKQTDLITFDWESKHKKMTSEDIKALGDRLKDF